MCMPPSFLARWITLIYSTPYSTPYSIPYTVPLTVSLTVPLTVSLIQYPLYSIPYTVSLIQYPLYSIPYTVPLTVSLTVHQPSMLTLLSSNRLSGLISL